MSAFGGKAADIDWTRSDVAFDPKRTLQLPAAQIKKVIFSGLSWLSVGATGSRSQELEAVTCLSSRSVPAFLAEAASNRSRANRCARYLAEVSDWELDATARCIKRRFQFRDYRTALAFANAVSVLAEEVWHHPELALGWGFCDVSLTTRKIGGVARVRFRDGGPDRCAGLRPT